LSDTQPKRFFAWLRKFNHATYRHGSIVQERKLEKGTAPMSMFMIVTQSDERIFFHAENAIAAQEFVNRYCKDYDVKEIVDCCK
jgi:hypothetical protein